jgi:hypothetical protein
VSRASAVNFIEQRIAEFNIECDFKRVPWSLFTEKGQQQSFVEKEKEAAEKAGLLVSETTPSPNRLNMALLSKTRHSLTR